ncbi:UNVERIFIED_CONTAM: Retrovirus-related Pol polyprotein from transposon TNT 1-94 [Sesamum calycinum]|uniref:Retrovirus-related Pol polyprotein from transposon TNT 1-94 n=1 Tax=Sesamum calycinum TaxID=2727403 RepID=A0AAW2KVX6_9LAMI
MRALRGKCFDPIAKKVAISRNVEFEEDVSWNWNIEKGERYHFLPHLEEEENEELEVEGYCDSDYAGDVDDHKSTIRFVFYFGENAISCSRKQPIVTISTCESKYVAPIAGTCHAIWLRRLLSELYFAHDGATKIMVDNKSAIALAKNSVFHDRSKHTDVKFHVIRDCITNKEITPQLPKCIPSTLHTENSKRGFFPPCFIS